MAVWKIIDKFDPQKDILSQILIHRGIVDKKDQEIFLNPPSVSSWFVSLPKYFLSSIKDAKKLILEYINQNKHIIIHGDYDVDGICASYILFHTIKNVLKYENVDVFIPNRFEHGYGLSLNSINFIKEKYLADLKDKDCLFITVDSGITAKDEVKYIKELGYKIIITDHHQKPEVLPDADCIVWNDQVVGTTVSWLCAVSLGLKDESFIAFCALATVTDLQPILNFNRSIVKKGLEILNSDPPLSLRSLLEVAGKSSGEIDTYDLGFVLGPRLNATGRVEGIASKSLRLLLEENKEESKKIAWELNQINSSRQDITYEMYELAKEFENQEEIPNIIISHHEDYHEGIIGLIASMLVQKYNRPSIVISISDDIAKGSVRSIPGINIIEILREMDDLFLSLGGHPMAAGFSIKRENIPALTENLMTIANTRFNDFKFEKVIEVDLEIPINEINKNTVLSLEKIRPHGLGNTQPIFCSRNLGVSSQNFVGSQNNHLSLKFFDGTNFYKAIYFNAVDLDLNLNQGNFVDILYTTKLNTYNEKTNIELIIKDIKKIRE